MEDEAEEVDFDWSDEDNIVLREQPVTAIYLNPHGAIVIRQQGSVLDESDALVVIQRANARAVALRMLAVLDMSHADLTDDTHDQRVTDRTAAARQQRYRDKKRDDRNADRNADTVAVLRSVPNG